jgi:hypothetical protein
MKKQRLEQLTNEMIEILIIDLQEENATEESQTIKFKHYNHHMLNGLIKNARAKYSLEWSADIIRDEVYATLYESMEIIAANMDIEELTLDNSEFMGQSYNLTMLKLKEKLIPRSKVDRNGAIIGTTELIVSPKAEVDADGNSVNLSLEDLLAGQIVYNTDMEEERVNHFLRWFDANKSKILTKKQIDFIDGGHIAEDKTNAYKMRKRISERVSRAYSEQYGDVSPRIAVLKDQERILEEILDAKSFRAAYDKYKDEDFIIDAVAEYVALDYLRAFDKGNDNPETIRAMRIALYKRLGEVINMIEAVK